LKEKEEEMNNIINTLKSNSDHSKRVNEINSIYASGQINDHQYGEMMADEMAVRDSLRTKYIALAFIAFFLTAILISS